MEVSKMRFNTENAVKNLRSIFPEWEEDISYIASVKSVSKSGMSRVIFVGVIKDNEVYQLSTGRVNGCGMDIVWATINDICDLAYCEKRRNAHLKIVRI